MQTSGRLKSFRGMSTQKSEQEYIPVLLQPVETIDKRGGSEPRSFKLIAEKSDVNLATKLPNRARSMLNIAKERESPFPEIEQKKSMPV